jgi:hypothetical protein
MSSDPKPFPPAGQILAGSQRVFSGGLPPNPIYTNNVEFGALGMDIFMDVGIVSPEALRAAIQRRDQEKSPTPPITDFLVNYRFGMTLQSAAMMLQRLSALLTATHEQLAQPDLQQPGVSGAAPADAPPPAKDREA